MHKLTSLDAPAPPVQVFPFAKSHASRGAKAPVDESQTPTAQSKPFAFQSFGHNAFTPVRVGRALI